MTSSENSSCLPKPATRTRGDGSLPSEWMSATSPRLPLISPSAMRALIPPSSALSTAPVAPPGLVTPWKRLTMIALAVLLVMSPDSTLIFKGCLLAAMNAGT